MKFFGYHFDVDPSMKVYVDYDQKGLRFLLQKMMKSMQHLK